ncbi:MAG: hypothetical protein JNL62_24155, partial [Bryobacterales bacterium]|nr:hypothetical protein [Bryobacterales bacterium]
MTRILRTAVSIILLAGTSMAVEPQGLLRHKEVKALAANAKTADDHRKLVRHYNAMAQKHEVEAAEHEELAAQYRSRPTANEAKRPMAPATASHCQYYADHCRRAAKEMKA